MIKAHLFTFTNHSDDNQHAEVATKSDKAVIDEYKNSKDKEFMDACGKVDKNRPATWAKYPNTIAGANDIIKMEFDELMKDAKDGNMKDWETNLYHLSVATLNAWRIYHGINK